MTDSIFPPPTDTPWQQNTVPGSAEQEFSNAYNNNFIAVIDVLPNIQFFLKAVDLPAVTNAPANVNTSVADFAFQGDKIEYGELNLTFFIDEYWYAYEEMFRWLRAIANPDQPEVSNGQFFGQCTVQLMNNNKEPFATLKFIDIFPSSVGTVSLSTQMDEAVLTCQATFRYTETKFDRVKGTQSSVFSGTSNTVLSTLSDK